MDSKTLSLLVVGVYLQSSTSNSDYISSYQNQLDIISGTIKHFEESCETIIMGDFQCCPSFLTSPTSGNPNSLSPLINDFISDNGMCPIDIINGTGPNYTYQHATLPNSSYIDHVLISDNLMNITTNTKVAERNHLNTGDHLPVSTTVTLPYHDTKIINNDNIDIEYIPNYMWNNILFTTRYQALVEKKISKLNEKTTLESKINC